MTLAQALISRARQTGAVLTLDGEEVRLRPGPCGVPYFTVEHLRANRDEVRSLLTLERFGPLTPGGKMCRRCFTINRCRTLEAGFICDGCRRNDDIPNPEMLPLIEAGGVVAAEVANRLAARNAEPLQQGGGTNANPPGTNQAIDQGSTTETPSRRRNLPSLCTGEYTTANPPEENHP